MATKKAATSNKTNLQSKKSRNKIILGVILIASVVAGFIVYRSFAGLNIIKSATGGPWTLTTELKTFNTLNFAPEVSFGSNIHMYQICIIGSTGGSNAAFYARYPFNSSRVTVGKYAQQVCTPATYLGNRPAFSPQLQKYSGPNIHMTSVYLVKVN